MKKISWNVNSAFLKMQISRKVELVVNMIIFQGYMFAKPTGAIRSK